MVPPRNRPFPFAAAEDRLAERIDRANRGEGMVISHHNIDIVRLVPKGRPPRREISEALASVEAVLQWRGEGRR